MTKNGIEVWCVFLLVIVFKISEPGHKKSQMGLVFGFGKVASLFMFLSHYKNKLGGAGLYRTRGCMGIQMCGGKGDGLIPYLYTNQSMPPYKFKTYKLILILDENR